MGGNHLVPGPDYKWMHKSFPTKLQELLASLSWNIIDWNIEIQIAKPIYWENTEFLLLDLK